jgi:hypothetical protein
MHGCHHYPTGSQAAVTDPILGDIHADCRVFRAAFQAKFEHLCDAGVASNYSDHCQHAAVEAQQ